MFAADDHRTYNRHGEAFDVGETFSGVDYDTGVDAAREFAALMPVRSRRPAQAALALGHPAARRHHRDPGGAQPGAGQANAAAAALPPLTGTELAAIEDLYDRRIRALVHDRW